MLKEIYEQPGVVRTALESYIDTTWTAEQGDVCPIKLDLPDDLLNKLEHIQIVGLQVPVGTPAW